jgi:gamma-butyrobetaine dioxygenase
MQIESATMLERVLRVRWDDGAEADFPYLWLRDNCASGFHPQTRERQFDLLSVPEDIRPERVEGAGEALTVLWDGHRSRFDAAWLRARRPGEPGPDPADLPPRTWGLGLEIPRHDAAAIMARDDALLAWLLDVRRLGLTIVEGLAPEPAAGVAVGERIGFLRPTNFGPTFEVVNKPDPNNLAYTAEALQLHTDAPNQELPPGVQFLHCIANEAEGGGSVFADSFRVLERLREREPDAFDLLARVPVPFRFHDDEADIRVRRPVIGLDERGRVSELRWSAHLADPFDMPAGQMLDYYRAYRLLMAETRDPAHAARVKLRPGEMAVFDNRRVLHGRDRFLPNTGFRHLHGFYVDRVELDSRIRLLARAGQAS